MLNIYYGDLPEVIYDPKRYFNEVYKDSWITDPLSIRMIKAVDKSDVINGETVLSPVFGNMSPKRLSGGVKTLILINNDPTHIFNASACGDNCAPWLLHIGEQKDITVNLRHLMDFGNGEFTIRVINTDKIVHNMLELIYEAGEFV